MNSITTLTSYPSWGTRCTRKIHRPFQMSRLALLIATALVNSPSYAVNLSLPLHNEDDPPFTVDLTQYFSLPATGNFYASSYNSSLLTVSLSGSDCIIIIVPICTNNGKIVTVTLQPNQYGSTIIETAGDLTWPNGGSAFDPKLYLYITVNPVNDAPVANNVALTTNEDTPLNSNLSATDIDSPSLTYSMVSNGSQGTAIITNTSTGAFTYTPKPDVNGTDSFTFKANDGFLDSNVATVTVTITPVNDPPILTATNPPTRHDDFGGYMVFKNWATFSPGKPADEANQTVLAYTVSKVSTPNLFAVLPAIDNSGTLTYVLADGQSGSSSFEVTVRDNGGTANDGVDTSAQTFTTNVLIAKINVREGGLNLLKGDTYDFGRVAVGGRQTLAFTIDNLGLYELLLTGSPHQIILLGNQAPNFSVDETNTTNFIDAGNHSTFSLTLTPAQLGTTSATVVIPNTDLRNGSYSFNVTGTGVPAKLLQVSLTGNGTGSVTSDPTGLDCSTSHPICTLPVADAPKWISLTATPAAGSGFTGWTGDPACTAIGQVLMLQDTSCTAEFTLKNYQLTANFIGKGRVTGPGIDCPGQCTATYLYGTTVTLKAQVTRKMWEFSSWRGCDSQGNIQITNDVLCQAVFTPDPNIPNAGDGNGDGLPDAYQDNVVSLPDKVTGTYLTLEARPATCVISDIYPDLSEAQTIKLDHTKKFPQGMLYFDIACPQAQVSVYYHGMSKVSRNLKFYKFGPKIPGDLTTIAWYQLSNIKYEVVMIGGKPVVKGIYTLIDGELGDSTGVDGHIIDPIGLVEVK